MKKFSIALLLVLLLTAIVPAAFAEDDIDEGPVEYYRAIDEAGLLSEYELDSLRSTLDSISERYNTNVCVITVSSLEGYSAEATADYYQEELYQTEGILLLVSIGDREWHMTTGGRGIQTFTDYGLEYLENCFLDDLSGGYYYDAFTAYARGAEYLLQFEESGEPYDIYSAPKEPYNPIRSGIISVIVGLFGALIYATKLKGELKTVRFQPGAAAYTRQGSFQLTSSGEMFLYRNVSKTARETSSSHGGSSTHVSSGGHSHGGRGGHF